ncbi:MAG: hypothetical protein V4634_20005 [Pseudomonadota bacterium]
MFRFISIIFLCLVMTDVSFAQVIDPPVKNWFTATPTSAKNLARILGLPQILDAAKKRTEQNSTQQLNVVVAQLKKNGVPEEVVVEMVKRADLMIKRVANSWSTTEAAEIYANEIAMSLTTEELRDAEEYFASDEGKKSYDAIIAGQAKMSAYISSKTTEAMNTEFAEFLEQAKKISKEYRDKQKKP